MKKFNFLIFIVVLIFSELTFAQFQSPVLDIPANSTEYYAIDPAFFSWGSVDSADFYEIQIDDTSDFLTPIVNEQVDGAININVSSLFSNWKFFWRVRAGREIEPGIFDYSNWSDVFFFTSVYMAPDNHEPSDGSTDMPYNDLQLSWTITLDPVAQNGNNSYTLQISFDNSFTNIEYEEQDIFSQTTTIPKLNPSSTYYWRVKFINDFGESGWSVETNFTTRSLPLGAVILISPEDDIQDLPPTNVFLEWFGLSGADGYDLEISRDSSFLNIIESISIIDTTYMTSLTTYYLKHFWRVRAERNSDKGLWSEIWRFTTSIAPPESSPVLLTPADSSLSLPPISVQFQWDSVSGAESYNFNISENENFSDYILKLDSLDTTAITIDTLSYGIRYYWQTSAQNAAGEGPWSEVWTFQTQIFSGIFPDPGNIPLAIHLDQNYPNPFNPETTIRYKLAKSEKVNLYVYNSSGQIVRKLLDGVNVKAGEKSVIWRGDNDAGQLVASGVYLYMLWTSDYRVTKKMILIK